MESLEYCRRAGLWGVWRKPDRKPRRLVHDHYDRTERTRLTDSQSDAGDTEAWRWRTMAWPFSKTFYRVTISVETVCSGADARLSCVAARQFGEV